MTNLSLFLSHITCEIIINLAGIGLGWGGTDCAEGGAIDIPTASEVNGSVHTLQPVVLSVTVFVAFLVWLL